MHLSIPKWHALESDPKLVVSRMPHLDKGLHAVRDREGLVQFLDRELGYRVNPIFFEATDLRIPPYLSRQVDTWWLVSNYPGHLPFQIHLVQIGELPAFNLCRVNCQNGSGLPGTTGWGIPRIPTTSSGNRGRYRRPHGNSGYC